MELKKRGLPPVAYKGPPLMGVHSLPLPKCMVDTVHVSAHEFKINYDKRYVMRYYTHIFIIFRNVKNISLHVFQIKKKYIYEKNVQNTY